MVIEYLVSCTSFSIGLRFYYWPEYKDMEEVPQHSGTFLQNINNHLCYKINELYINKMYLSFKQEISNYSSDYLTVDKYNMEILPKAVSYLGTNYAKSIQAKVDCFSPAWYGIIHGSTITLSHLIAVILYCDYTKLSTHFSSTFRKSGPWDTLQNIKNRNRKYFWMSKLLRETVEIFGAYSVGRDQLIGPFYSGLSKVINFPNFFIRLSSPTSTSIHIEVAMKFSGDQGMIMKLNNPKGSNQCRLLRGFDCSFISLYEEEAERYYHIFFCFIYNNLFVLLSISCI